MKLLPHVVKLGFPLVIGVAAIGAVSGWLVGADHAARAQVAVAHSMLVSAYYMLQRDQPYHELGPDWHSRRNNEAHTRRLVQQLERLGHTVILDAVA